MTALIIFITVSAVPTLGIIGALALAARRPIPSEEVKFQMEPVVSRTPIKSSIPTGGRLTPALSH